MGRRPFDPGLRRGRPAQDRRAHGPERRPRGVWGEAIRDRFLALLRETGNAAAALRVVGHANMFRKRRRRDPEFAVLWAEAVAAADARLCGAESAFPKTPNPLTPSSSGTGPSPGRAQESPNSPQGRGAISAVERLGGFAIADPATLLRPGPKKKPKERGHVIRRTRGGRAQIALARECEMTAETEADFLARLRATGNFSGSARALGFQPASLFERARRWPAFAKACDEALADASVQLDYALVAYAHKLLRAPGMGTVTFTRGGASFPRRERESDCPPGALPPSTELGTGFDPDRAMRILAFLDRRRGRGTGRGRRKGPPQRSFDEAVASVLAKIEAIERHEKRKGGEVDGASPSPSMGEGWVGVNVSAHTERVSQVHPTPCAGSDRPAIRSHARGAWRPAHPPHQGEGD